MSLCVTRQYHALRVARSAALQLRPGACSLTSSRIALRFHQSALYSSSSDPGSPPNSAIIVPRSLAVSPETLVKHIVPLQKHHYRKSRFAVFFVTPSFAPWLLDDHKFLTKAVHQAFLPLLADDKYAKVHSLIAVVDKLPTPLSVDGTKSVEDEITSRIHTPPVSDVGHEGVGYMYLRPQDFAGSVERTGFDQNGTIGFTIAEGSTKNGQFLDLLQLPLANTVFQTGSPATMTLSTWEKQKESREFTLTNKSDLVHQTLRIHTPESADPPNAFAIPLVPMTSPRQVEASMGNIVRRVLDPSGKSVTASEELEKTVPQYFKARGEPSQSISVWALLIPRDLVDSIQAETTALLSKANTQVSSTDTASWDNLWSKKSTAWNDIVTSALSKGARLHRVLSGGGGWGKKAGLLSLDPSFNNEELVTSAVQDLPSDMQALDELSSALHQVVQDGDSVQFFVSPAADLDTNDQSEVLNKISESENLWSYEFGMIPSTADALETRSWQRNNAASQDVTVFRNTFGALSEGGMTMKRQILGDKGQHIIAGGTKIDVPFSRYSSIEPAEDVCSPHEE
ncbi:hypothetical protein BU24DRAFT_423930 [Aaosphaeria arxii CBS 175.79]|uniref:V-type c subunit family protein n=1 Tax=Aaosphaeria arxii CBS 175.79 TaxID=1450172 RepID=A0A6A5XQ39_9PLEO|nr:uncharacterized protein BU24DRAFT_423930 [Aaosphaeria arxii CBS 175.79]KAF2015009.1 hypothetical protein BU24DRAFT_423930 [Aaosphaeria arxii CBS 175.79]